MNWFKYLIATLGGFQFGYTIGIMSGAILFLVPEFQLTTDQQALAMSAFLLGMAPGSALAGPLVNWLGRKKMQQGAAVLFILGTITLFMAPAFFHLMLGRIIQGLAVGIFGVVGPIYLAEVSPPAKRGFFIGCYQLAVTLGIVIAYCVSLLFSSSGDWKSMFLVGIVPALVLFFGFFFLPDSHSPKQTSDKSAWKTLLEPATRSTLLLVIFINVFQQITGINALLYFAPSIFQAAGFTSPVMALIPTLVVGIINVVMTLVSNLAVDKWGRRPLLLVGIAGMILSLAGLTVAFLTDGTTMKWLTATCMMSFIACFALGLGPMPQLLAPELFPRSVRGIGISIGGMSNQIFNYLVVYSFIDMTSRFSHAGTFGIYAVLGIAALYFVWKFIPETKGRVID